MEDTQGKACAMMCGEPEVIEKLMQSLLGMADMADEHGLRGEADSLTSMISDVKMMKAAQYEGFQNYWIANGRAFELAFKHRLEAQTGDEKSFHQAWMDTLQDYMDSLLGPQTEYIGKNLKMAQYEGFQNYWLQNSRAFELAFKKKLEAQKEDEKSFCKAWCEVLEEYQNCFDRQENLHDALKKTASTSEKDMAMVVIAEAERRKVTLADLYCEWTECHREALKGLLVMASAKIENGKVAPVAFYEALDYYASGDHSRDTIRRIISIAEKVEPELFKSAGFMDSMRQMWWNWKSMLLDAWDKVTMQHGVGSQLLNKITAMGTWFVKTYNELKSKLNAAPNASLDPAFVNNAIGPYIEQVRALVSLVRTSGSAARIPEMPELFSGANPNPDFFDPELNGMGEQEFDDYMNRLSNILFQVRSAAKEYDKSQKEGIVGTPAPSDPGKFEKILGNALSVVAGKLTEILRPLAIEHTRIKFEEMIPKIKVLPWPSIMETAATNAGISQGRAQSAGSINDATMDITSAYMQVVNEYVTALMNEIAADRTTNPNEKKTKRAQVDLLMKAHYEVVSKRIAELLSEKYNLAGAGAGK